MNAQEIAIKGTDTVVCHRCGGCGQMFATNDAAEQCCIPYHCDTCGRETRRFFTRCEACKDHHRILKAVVVPLEDQDMVYHDSLSNEGYINVDELEDELEEMDSPPAYVFATTFTRLSLDADNILENVLQDHHEDAYFEAEDELRAFIADFDAKQRSGSYHPDYSRVVVLDQIQFDALIAKAREQEAARNAKRGAS